jgi:CheY-like chemotaxis protein
MQVDTASDGKTALARLKKAVRENRPYDVILLDWLMPQMDGIETARRIRRNPELSDLPVIAMTAHAMPGDLVARYGHRYAVLLHHEAHEDHEEKEEEKDYRTNRLIPSFSILTLKFRSNPVLISASFM